ncbi:flagellar basal body P-ring formation protein FlgA [bacterium]|nr:flagellar basal body P-ring formation protein FlgA [bacterium]
MGLILPLLASAAPRIILLDYQLAEGERIELGEVALLEEWPPEEEARLDRLDLGRAPDPGRVQLLKSVFVKQNVYKTLGRTDGFEFIAEPFHRVLGEGTVFTSQQLKEAARAFVFADTGWNENEVALTPGRSPQDLYLPPGDYQLSVRRLSADYYGPTVLKVSALADGVEKGFRTVQFTIARTLPAMVVTRTLAAGETIAPGDLELRPVLLLAAADEARLLASAEQAAGKRTRRILTAGSPLKQDDLENPMLIQRGDTVEVWVRSGPVTIKTRGEAEKNGRAGERIPVSANGRDLWGQVVSKSLVIAEVK